MTLSRFYSHCGTLLLIWKLPVRTAGRQGLCVPSADYDEFTWQMLLLILKARTSDALSGPNSASWWFLHLPARMLGYATPQSPTKRRFRRARRPYEWLRSSVWPLSARALNI